MTRLKPFHKGKVRDLYAIGEDKLLLIASDRVSAFDFVLPTPIPGKGELLNKISLFWFAKTGHIIKNHLITADPAGIERQLPAGHGIPLTGGAVLVKRTKRVDFECVVRGYITGSGWKEYLKSGTICGIKLPAGLKEAQKLPEPVFTPTSKADRGHDEPVSFEELSAGIGREKAEFIRAKSLELYGFAAAHAESRGIILADTKFEFGELGGEIILIDEALTPDSSRFWDAAGYKIGASPESFDKQFLRDWLEKESGWDRKSPPPRLPAKVVEGTAARYRSALEKLVT